VDWGEVVGGRALLGGPLAFQAIVTIRWVVLVCLPLVRVSVNV
jgi:hypothetical protein